VRRWPSAICQIEGATGQMMARKNKLFSLAWAKSGNRQRIKALSNKCAGSEKS